MRKPSGSRWGAGVVVGVAAAIGCSSDPGATSTRSGAGGTAASTSVSVLFNLGDGTFAAAVEYPAGAKPRSVAVGDFNVDGHPDLAVADDGDGTVSVLFNLGKGTFAAAVTYTPSPWWRWI